MKTNRRTFIRTTVVSAAIVPFDGKSLAMRFRKLYIIEEIGRKMGIVDQDTGTEPDWDDIARDLKQLSIYTLSRINAGLRDERKERSK